ncbi:hypothetical protein [Mucilaginibacter gilvus]|uniref:Uncharacterized protein n=1 Tax=Mucilaginibacter gilvus TaxID=2305909 RepID=A0A3S3Z639_9SPHI|nr:hypothetical protein [Mucilaginibacter gilvus]RWY54065.1 hypothetical protein EPL05_08445 [Mucilaginibacter gilvus]
MKNSISLILFLFATTTINAQKIALPPFLRWQTNNAPGCKNVFITKDSMLMAVKNKCVSEGILANWRPSVGVNEGLNFSVPSNGRIQLTITYKFDPAGGDVLAFYGSFDPVSDNSDIAFSRMFQLPGGATSLPAAGGYATAILQVNFSNESDKPIWNALTALKGTMNFHFNVTANGGETHHGSIAVIKSVKLEVK